MRYDVQNRIMSLSFERDPKEHAEIMLLAGRRFVDRPRTPFTVSRIAGVVAFAAVFGLAMELYRRYLLTYIADISSLPTLNILILQMLPILAVLGAAVTLYVRSVNKKAARALEERLEKQMFIDTDIFPEGIRLMSGTLNLQVDWPAIRNVTISDERIEFEGEVLVIYLPHRAFTSRADFNLRTKELRRLWQDAVKKARDSQPQPRASAS